MRFPSVSASYVLIRGLAALVAGKQEDETFAVALVEFQDALIPAFIVEEHDDGAYTVFVPSVPTPAAGAVYILPKERVHLVDIPVAKAASVITKWGAGARDLRPAMMKSEIGADLPRLNFKCFRTGRCSSPACHRQTPTLARHL